MKRSFDEAGGGVAGTPPKPQPLTREGMDRIGPFHPYVVFGGVLLFDLIALLLVIAALTVAGDKTEDVLFPGGEEWVEF